MLERHAGSYFFSGYRDGKKVLYIFQLKIECGTLHLRMPDPLRKR